MQYCERVQNKKDVSVYVKVSIYLQGNNVIVALNKKALQASFFFVLFASVCSEKPEIRIKVRVLIIYCK